MKSSPERDLSMNTETKAVIFDGQAIFDITMRAILAAGGFERGKILELLVTTYKGDTQPIADEMERINMRTKAFAAGFGSLLRLVAIQYLQSSGCPDHGIKVNLDFILKAAMDDPTTIEIPKTRGKDGRKKED